MKDFFQFREEAEFLSESKLTGSLNKLQSLWNDNAEHNMEIGVMPMFSRPWDRITKGGVLVVGINPANTPNANKERMKLYKKSPGEQEPVWDKKNRRFRSTDVGRSPNIKGPHTELQLTYSQLSKEFEKRGGKSNQKYISGLRKFFQKLESDDLFSQEDEKSKAELKQMTADEREEYRKERKRLRKRSNKLMMVNYIPFPSKDEAALNKMKNLPEIEKYSKIYLRNFIDVAKPEVIIFFGSRPWKKTGLVAREVPEKSVNAISSSGRTTDKGGKSLGKLLRVGFTSDDIPVLGFMHPSGSQTGGIDTKNYTRPDRLRMIKKIFDEYVEK